MRSMRQAAYAGLVFVVVVAGVPGTAQAQDRQDRIGGHIGVVFPLVTHVEGNTVTIGDDFKIGVPMGITVKTGETVAFDLEIVPVLDPQKNGPIGVPLTIHPGILKSLGHGLTLGGRVAFDINGASWGFTPLLNKGFPMGNVTWFVEAVVPIRFQDDVVGETHTAIGFALHTGVAF